MRDIATSLHNVLGLDLKCSWVINLLEVTCEITLMVVLPLDESRDLISEFRIGNVASCFIHSSLITAFESRRLLVVPETSTLVACLMLDLAPNDVEN